MTTNNQIARKCRELAAFQVLNHLDTEYFNCHTRHLLQKAADEIDRLEAALAECAAPFAIGCFYERLAREFNRRQKIAAEALTGGKL